MSVTGQHRGGRLLAWAIATPLLLGIIVFALYPFVYLILLSISDSNLGQVFREWVGGDNYADALTDDKYTASIGRSVGFALFTTALAMVLGLAVALLLDQAVRARNLLRTLILLPLLTPPVTVAVMWQLLLTPHGGWLNSFLADLGLITQPISFLGQPTAAFGFLCLADVWQWTPFVALMTFAALQTQPEEVVDAARMDGATPWQLFTHVTLPMLLPALLGIALIKLVIAFKVFDLVFVLTAGGPGQATTVSSFHIYRVAIQQFDIGMAATQTLVLAIVVGLVTLPFTMAHDRAERRLG
ncbi:MAG: carbohydrate ABC transporter permease [Geminicoccaceae bacterium]